MGEIACKDLVELVTGYLDGGLDEPTLNLVEEHLIICDWCVTYVDQMQSTVEALAALPSENVPDGLQRAVAQALREAGSR